MSRVLILKATLLSVLGVTVGAGAMWAFHGSSKQEPLRRIATLDAKSPRFLGKHLSLVQVSLQSPEGIPDNEGDQVTLVGAVRLDRDVNSDLRYRWELPDGVNVVSGQVEDSLRDLKAGDVAEVRLTVTGFSREELKLISLNGFVQDGDSLLGNSASLTSRPEDSLEMLNAASGLSVRKPSSDTPILKGKIIR